VLKKKKEKKKAEKNRGDRPRLHPFSLRVVPPGEKKKRRRWLHTRAGERREEKGNRRSQVASAIFFPISSFSLSGIANRQEKEKKHRDETGGQGKEKERRLKQQTNV